MGGPRLRSRHARRFASSRAARGDRESKVGPPYCACEDQNRHNRCQRTGAALCQRLFARGVDRRRSNSSAAPPRTRGNQIVRQRSRLKNIIQSILHAHLVPSCPHQDLCGPTGRAWLSEQILPGDERLGAERHLLEFDRLGDDLKVMERDLARSRSPTRESSA